MRLRPCAMTMRNMVMAAEFSGTGSAVEADAVS